jgi:hypothetical protein
MVSVGASTMAKGVQIDVVTPGFADVAIPICIGARNPTRRNA